MVSWMIFYFETKFLFNFFILNTALFFEVRKLNWFKFFLKSKPLKGNLIVLGPILRLIFITLPTAWMNSRDGPVARALRNGCSNLGLKTGFSTLYSSLLFCDQFYWDKKSQISWSNFNQYQENLNWQGGRETFIHSWLSWFFLSYFFLLSFPSLRFAKEGFLALKRRFKRSFPSRQDPHLFHS